jgi:hypothetical protein
VQITSAPGGTIDQKKTLYRAIGENLEASPGVPKADTIINLVECPREIWSFGSRSRLRRRLTVP